jgi:hypothetical protein
VRGKPNAGFIKQGGAVWLTAGESFVLWNRPGLESPSIVEPPAIPPIHLSLIKRRLPEF